VGVLWSERRRTNNGEDAIDKIFDRLCDMREELLAIERWSRLLVVEPWPLPLVSHFYRGKVDDSGGRGEFDCIFFIRHVLLQ
jgi:hypothetical protein